jgi:anthranilate synthase component I
VTHTLTLVADALTPVRAYAALRRAGGDGASFLLESVVSGERWGRYSILGYRPRSDALLTRRGWVVTGDARSVILAKATDPFEAAAALFAREDGPRPATPAERFARAQIGYVAWDVVHALEKVADWGDRHVGAAARFLGGATIVVFDNLRQTVTLAAESQADVERARVDLSAGVELAPLPLPDPARLPRTVDVDVDDAAYEAMVRRGKEYIAAGDAFQIVLARTFSVPKDGRDPFDVYRAMRVLNPSPYMYFLDLPPAPGETARTQIAGASPEPMVRLEDGVMTIRPVAGTRPRGKTEAADDANARELLADPKERAEHVMLIDLARNDVGRVADVGSVSLVKQMEIERFSHVMHIVSEVHGKISPSVSPLEVLRAALPAGTLSGAPKVRAMQIIRELESRPRGVYGGAVGYVSASGDLDFAIAIRTAVCRGDTFEVTAGAGIVEASDPKSEADETRAKARAVLCALEAVPRGKVG